MPKSINFRFPEGWYFLNWGKTELKRSSKIFFSVSGPHRWAIVAWESQSFKNNQFPLKIDTVKAITVSSLEACKALESICAGQRPANGLCIDPPVRLLCLALLCWPTGLEFLVSERGHKALLETRARLDRSILSSDRKSFQYSRNETYFRTLTD